MLTSPTTKGTPRNLTTVNGTVGIDQTTAGANNVEVLPVAMANADVHAPAANTAAVVTYAANATLKHVITGIVWSYTGGIPVGGNLLVQDGAATVFTVDIDESGPGIFTFPSPKKQAAANANLVITLAAGGAGITGKVSILNHWTEI